MIRNILKQILNRKKSNGWIAFALLLVFCLIWYTTDFFFVLAYNEHITSHRDVNNTYSIDIATRSKKHPEYKETESESFNEMANFHRIINRIKEHPDIESVGLCISKSSFPGTGGFSSTQFRNPDDTTKTASIQSITIIPEEDYFKVFRHTKDNGISSVTMSDYDWGDPSAIIITQMLANQLFPGESPINKTIEREYKHPDHPRGQNRIIGVIDDIKRFKHNRPHCAIFFPQKINEQNYKYAYISIRTKEHIPEKYFIENFKKEMSSKLRIGNYYLKNVQSFVRIDENTNYLFGTTNSIRIRGALMAFFLINIILCTLGIFWYRVNIRHEEIGIRRAMGSDAVNIRKLFILEGLLLLTLIVPFAMIIEMQFVQAELIETLDLDQILPAYGNYLTDHIILRFLITNGITWFLMAIIITLSIWYPARSASRINTVDALRDE